MTANHAHTPTTEQVRLAHAESVTFHVMEEPELTEANNMFDRWLATVEAAAEQRGAERALREARSDWFQYADAINDTPSKYYPALWLKNRADLLEGDGD